MIRFVVYPSYSTTVAVNILQKCKSGKSVSTGLKTSVLIRPMKDYHHYYLKERGMYRKGSLVESHVQDLYHD